MTGVHDNRFLYANFANFVILSLEILGERDRKSCNRIADGQHVGGECNANDGRNYCGTEHYGYGCVKCSATEYGSKVRLALMLLLLSGAEELVGRAAAA